MFIYFWEWKTECEWGRGREREGDTRSKTGSRLWAVSTELDTGLELRNSKIMTSAKAGHLTKWTTQAPLLLLILMGVLCASWMDVCFLIQIREVFGITSSNKFSALFSLSSFSGTRILWVLLHLMESLSSLSLFSCCITLLSLFCSASLFCVTLSSRSLIHFSSSSLLFIVSNLFLISFIAFFISDWYFFNSFISKVRVSLIPFTFFWSPVSILMIIALNSLSGVLLVSVLCRSLLMALSFSLIWDRVLSVLILCKSLPASVHKKSQLCLLFLRSNGLVTKKSYSAQGLALQEMSPVHAVCGLLLCSGCCVLQASHRQSLSLPAAGSVLLKVAWVASFN